MKTSVSLSVFDADPGMPVLYSGATLENLEEIKSFGYDGVDLFVREPWSIQTKSAVKRLGEYGLGIGVVMPAALAKEGLFLGAENPEIRKKARYRIGEIVKFTAEVDGMVSLGLVRGSKQRKEPMEEFEKRFAESCRCMLELSQPLGVDLLIEPINRYEINTINSVRQGIDFIQKTQLSLFLMLDTFHMNIEDADISQILTEAIPYTKHIHFLDSNRLAPSMGHMCMETYYKILEKSGYDGYLCLEALPVPSSSICARTGAEFFSKMKGA